MSFSNIGEVISDINIVFESGKEDKMPFFHQYSAHTHKDHRQQNLLRHKCSIQK